MPNLQQTQQIQPLCCAPHRAQSAVCLWWNQVVHWFIWEGQAVTDCRVCQSTDWSADWQWLKPWCLKQLTVWPNPQPSNRKEEECSLWPSDLWSLKEWLFCVQWRFSRWTERGLQRHSIHEEELVELLTADSLYLSLGQDFVVEDVEVLVANQVFVVLSCWRCLIRAGRNGPKC